MEREYDVHIKEPSVTGYVTINPNSQQNYLTSGGNIVDPNLYNSPKINYVSGPNFVNNRDNVAERVSALLNRVELVRSELAQLTSSVANLVASIDETKHERRTLSINKDDSSTNK